MCIRDSFTHALRILPGVVSNAFRLLPGVFQEVVRLRSGLIQDLGRLVLGRAARLSGVLVRVQTDRESLLLSERAAARSARLSTYPQLVDLVVHQCQNLSLIHI